MGKQKALNPEDLWDLPYSDEAATVSQVCAFLSIWHILTFSYDQPLLVHALHDCNALFTSVKSMRDAWMC